MKIKVRPVMILMVLVSALLDACGGGPGPGSLQLQFVSPANGTVYVADPGDHNGLHWIITSSRPIDSIIIQDVGHGTVLGTNTDAMNFGSGPTSRFEWQYGWFPTQLGEHIVQAQGRDGSTHQWSAWTSICILVVAPGASTTPPSDFPGTCTVPPTARPTVVPVPTNATPNPTPRSGRRRPGGGCEPPSEGCGAYTWDPATCSCGVP